MQWVGELGELGGLGGWVHGGWVAVGSPPYDLPGGVGCGGRVSGWVGAWGGGASLRLALAPGPRFSLQGSKVNNTHVICRSMSLC